MPKKKKKSRASTGDDSADSGPRTPSKSKGSKENVPGVVDLFSLRIVPSSTPPVKTLRYTPMVLLTEDDADRSDLLAGDFVFLLSTVDSDNTNGHPPTLQASAMARVHVASSSFNSPLKSPLNHNKDQRSKLSPGHCHVYPASLARRLQENTTQSISDDTARETPPPTTPVSETPTPKQFPTLAPSSKSKFSFAKGGGGDSFISTPTQGRTRTASRTPNTPPNSLCLWVIPMESSLGDQLVSLICYAATRIELKVIDGEPKPQLDASSTQESSMQMLLKRSLGQQLIRAHIEGSYVSQGSRVALSVQGKSVTCEVLGIHATTSTTASAPTDENNLNERLAELSLDNDVQSDKSTNDLLNAIKTFTQLDAFQERGLFRITQDTIITVSGGDDHASTNENSAEVASTQLLKPLVAGLDVVVEQVQSLLTTPLAHPELFRGNGALRLPKGVLLHGPSGCGKSVLSLQVARNLKLFHQLHVQHVHCATLQSKTALVGKAEKELVKMFETASKSRPGKKGSLVLLDDVHLICPRRQGMNVGADRLSATLLALLDGLDSQQESKEEFSPTFVLAITTNPSLLDPALRRPGRLDAEVEVPLPDEPAVRRDILRFLLENLGARLAGLSEEEWLGMARIAKGFTGADLQLAAKESVRAAVLHRQATSEDDSSASSKTVVITKQDMETAIRATKPSAIKSVTVEIPHVHWSSIGGMEEVKRQLREAIELPLMHGAMFQRLGIRPPRGVLLYGPPGCSKTLMARALATEGHMNFLAVKGPELLSKWLGESERALASLFRRARLASPSVIFFDEVDAIATKRGGGNSGGERLLSQLLTELDGIQSKDGGKEKEQRVVVVCATNRPDLLDSALMRPGRIDRMIYVGVPDLASRHRILEIGLKGKAYANDMDILHLAQDDISGGLSGAELIAACRDAALIAMEENQMMETVTDDLMIEQQHMTTALKSMGRQITYEMIDFYKEFQGKGSS